MPEQPPPLEDLEARLGYRFQNRELLSAAITHSSALQPSGPRLSERLEFLGDAVVGLAVSELLLERYPNYDEGRLSKLRAALVNATRFATKAQEVNLDRDVRLGKGEEKTGGRAKVSILAAVYEAVLGAVFLDGGYERARAVVARHFVDTIPSVADAPVTDPKTALQEFCQDRYRMTPVYTLVDTTGPDHARHFVVDVVLGDAVLARGEGTSKRGAEQAAARRALDEVGQDAGPP